MGEHQLDLHIDEDTKRRLETEARWLEQTEAEVATDAIKAYLGQQAHLRKVIEAAAAEADKGVFISSEAMMRWVEDLFDGKKTPPKTPVRSPPCRGGYPASSRACQQHSRNSRCWGSISVASFALMPQNLGSNSSTSSSSAPILTYAGSR